MTAALYQNILQHGAAVNLSSRAKLRLTGGDRVRYLNGQVTNDVRRAPPDATLYACVTDAKGRIAGDVCIHALDDALLLDAEPDLREPLSLRLERYIVADDVELADVTAEWQLWHVWGGVDTLARAESIHCGQECPHHLLRSTRFDVPGIDVWLPGEAAPPVFDVCPVLKDADLETWRILQKTPRWPHELNADTFPPEADLQDRAMDFAKGCYIGQEILSRIKTTGKMPRELIAWQADAEVAAEAEILNVAGKTIGKVTSVTTHPETGACIGLGFVRQGTSSDGLTASGAALQRR